MINIFCYSKKSLDFCMLNTSNIMNNIKKLLLNDIFVLGLIIANTILIFIEEFEFDLSFLNYIEAIFTVAFTLEMYIKIKEYGFKNFMTSGWNRFDFIVVILALPSLGTLFYTDAFFNLNILLSLRALRAFKAFRLFKFLPEADTFVVSIRRAIQTSYIVLIGFFILIVVVSLVSTSLYKSIAPEYFATPLHSFYSIFQLFTIEGWYEIPNLIAERSSTTAAFFTKLYFSFLLLIGGILGFSLVNSIFVDAMVSDNNDDLEAEVQRLNQKLESMNKKIDRLLENKKKS